ncbi:MAG TPA: hypothetical protein VKB10_04005 [Gaiellaceae bacterium]|nr:hypothetical protein [Gaiellaceae bacterium]
MGRSLVVAAFALLGLLLAAGMGYAAYVVSRGSVAVPVTKLQQAPAQKLTPRRVRTDVKPRMTSTPRTTGTEPPPPAGTTTDDHGGRSRGGSGRGGGHGGGD